MGLFQIHRDGRIPSYKDGLQIAVKGCLIASLVSIISFGWRLPGPGDLVGFSFVS